MCYWLRVLQVVLDDFQKGSQALTSALMCYWLCVVRVVQDGVQVEHFWVERMVEVRQSKIRAVLVTLAAAF